MRNDELFEPKRSSGVALYSSARSVEASPRSRVGLLLLLRDFSPPTLARRPPIPGAADPADAEEEELEEEDEASEEELDAAVAADDAPSRP